MTFTLTASLRRFLTLSNSKIPKSQTIFWFSLSLTFALIYAWLGLQEAFSSEYVVQDDARQHVFWMQRFIDQALLKDDLIADYFQSVAPAGYTTVYQLVANLGINPLLFNKFLPLGLGLITTSYCFVVCLEMLPVPACGFMASLLLNQTLWMDDDLVSGTSRAFFYVLLLAFLYYLLRRSLLPCLGAIALQGLFCPQCVFLSTGVLCLQLLQWEAGKVKLSGHRRDYWFCATGLAVALLVLLPYALTTSQFGPTISVAQAKALPEFFPGGRASFFNEEPRQFWLKDDRSGMLSRLKRLPISLSLGLLLPILLKYTSFFPLAKKVTGKTIVLAQLMLVSLGLFFLAHAVLFKLHLPSRYTKHSLRITLAISAAIVLIILLDAILDACQKYRRKGRQSLVLGAVGLIFFALILYPPFLSNFPKTNYTRGKIPAMYEFFAQQPKDILIASVAQEADNLPTFSARSVLVSREYGIPYHTGYYNQFRQRAIDLVKAQYSPNLTDVQNFIKKYGIDFWLIEERAFSPDYIANSWIRQFQPVATEAQTSLAQGTTPALLNLGDRCSVFKSRGFVVLEAKCISELIIDN
ncbi:MAG: hypothetical protein WA919_08515 [Coleofasciculaceae cyanobacterium]